MTDAGVAIETAVISRPSEPHNYDRQIIRFEKSTLQGEVKVGGAKNCGPKLMIASCLAAGQTTLKNMPVIGDVEVTAQVLRSLGAEVKYGEDDTIVIVIPEGINNWVVPQTTGEASRISILAAGMLLARFGQADIPLPGGDKIGKRAIDIHLNGLKALGAKVDETTTGRLKLTAEDGLIGCNFRLEKPSHTATENLIMAATRAKGTTTLSNCAREPEVDALVDHLSRSGAKIQIIDNDPSGERVIIIEGVNKMQGTETRVMVDRNAVVTYAVAALTTGSEEGIFVRGAKPEHLESFLELIHEMGGKYEIRHGEEGGIRFYLDKGHKLNAPKRTVITCPHPGISNEKYIGIMTDWQPIICALLLKAEGDSRLIETMYSNRFQHLQAVEAEIPGVINFFDPKKLDPAINYLFEDDDANLSHGALIHGGKDLPELKIKGSDVRLGAFAALMGVANGGELIGTKQLRRGYHRLIEDLQNLGAKSSAEVPLIKASERPLSVLDEAIANIHRELGLEYPADYSSLTGDRKIDQLRERALKQKGVRGRTVEVLEAMYGREKPDIVVTAKIMAEIAPDLDDIFIAQMILHNSGTEPVAPANIPPRSWHEYDPEAASRLADNLNNILSGHLYQEFLQRNPEIESILANIKRLVNEKNPDELEKISESMIDSAIKLFETGKPIIWISLCTYWTHPTSTGEEKPTILNPDAQLLIPFEDDARVDNQRQAQSVWQVYKNLYPNEVSKTGINEKEVNQIVGTSVLWCGGEIGSYSSGENLKEGYFFIPSNILDLKIIPRLKQIFEILGKRDFPADIMEYVTMMYAFHEEGHKIFYRCTREYEELATEIPTYIAMISEIENQNGILHHLDLETLVRVIVAENVYYAGKGTAEFLAYRLSSRYILSQLLESGMISWTENDIEIKIDKEKVEKFFASLRKTHNEIMETKDGKVEFVPHPDLDKFES